MNSAVSIRKVGGFCVLGTELVFNGAGRRIEADLCSAGFESTEVDKREPAL
jgi:hypothetical protein